MEFYHQFPETKDSMKPSERGSTDHEGCTSSSIVSLTMEALPKPDNSDWRPFAFFFRTGGGSGIHWNIQIHDMLKSKLQMITFVLWIYEAYQPWMELRTASPVHQSAETPFAPTRTRYRVPPTATTSQISTTDLESAHWIRPKAWRNVRGQHFSLQISGCQRIHHLGSLSW